MRAAAALCVERLSHITWGNAGWRALRARARGLLARALPAAWTTETDAVAQRHLIAAAGAWKLRLRLR